MSHVLEKLNRGPVLKRVIQDQVKQFITDQHLKPGDLLPPEGQLASDLGVGRGSVREAIKSLESLGIVEVRHGSGVCVREFNFDSVLDFLSYGLVFEPAKAIEVLQIREWLEAAAVAQAVAAITEAQLQEIERVLEVWEVKAMAGMSTAQEDRSFHRILHSAVGNASLLSLIDIFWVAYNALPQATVGEDAHPLETLQAHRDLFHAVRRREPLLAQQQMQEHFRNIKKRLGDALASSSASPQDAQGNGTSGASDGRTA